MSTAEELVPMGVVSTRRPTLLGRVFNAGRAQAGVALVTSSEGVNLLSLRIIAPNGGSMQTIVLDSNGADSLLRALAAARALMPLASKSPSSAKHDAQRPVLDRADDDAAVSGRNAAGARIHCR